MAPAKPKKVSLTIKNHSDTRAKRPRRGRKEKLPIHEGNDQNGVEEGTGGHDDGNLQSLEVVNGERDVARTASEVDEIAAMRSECRL